MFLAAPILQLSAQDLKSEGSIQLKNTADNFIRQAQYVDARPYIQELITRLEPGNDKSQLEGLYFFMGYGYVQEYQASESKASLSSALDYFEKVISGWPNGSLAVKAIELKANCYNGLGQFEEAADTWALNLKPPYVKNLHDYQKYNLIKKISQAYYNKKSWDKGAVWFPQMFAAAKNIEDKTYAAAALIRMHLANGEFEEASKYYPYLTNNVPAKYDILLSVDLLTAGNTLARQKRYADAALCLTFVQTKEDITEFMSELSKRIEVRLGELKKVDDNDPRIEDLSNRKKYADFVVKQLADVESYTSILMARIATNYYETQRDYESFWAYRQLLDEYPDDKLIEDYYFAAFVCARRLAKEKQIDALASEYLQKFPEGKYLKSLKIQFALFLIDTKQIERFYQIAYEALDADPSDEISAQYIFLIGKNELESKRAMAVNPETGADSGVFNEMRVKFTDFYTANPESPAAPGALYWVMMSHLVCSNYKDAYEAAEKLLTAYPECEYKQDASYRRAVAMFGMGDPNSAAKAKELFMKFIEDFKNSGSDTLGEAELFLGDIFFIENDFENSYAHYMAVSDLTQKQSLIDAAYLHCASMLESNGDFEKQADTLKRYIKNYPEADTAMAAYMLRMPLLKQGYSADAVRGYMDAIKNYGSKAENDSVDKILVSFPEFYTEAKTQLDATTKFLKELTTSKELLEMFVLPKNVGPRYRYTIENPDVNPLVYSKFVIQSGKKTAEIGPEALKDPKAINELLKFYSNQQSKFPRETPKVFFENTMREAKAKSDTVLERRMQMALDEIKALKERPGMFAPEDFEGMSNKVLVWMAKCNEKYDAASSRKALQTVLDSDSDYRLDAFFALGELEERARQYVEAAETYKKAADAYPTNDLAPRATIKECEILIKLSRVDEAVQKLDKLLAIPLWPAEIKAEVLYRLGVIQKAKSNNASAISYFERCALGYSSCHEFAGKAVLEAAKLYMLEGKKDKAIESCTDYVQDTSNSVSPDYKKVQDYLKTLR